MHDAEIFALDRGALFAAIAGYCQETQQTVRQKGHDRHRGIFTDKFLANRLATKYRTGQKFTPERIRHARAQPPRQGFRE